MPPIAQTTWKLRAGAGLAFAIILAVLFALMRVIGTHGPANLRLLLPLGFVLMAMAPWLLLSSSGRRKMGLQGSARPAIYLQAVLLGAAAAFLCFLVGQTLFGSGVDNWFVTIAKNFSHSVNHQLPMWQLFLMFTLPSMILSPVGEELFFRGLLQDALAQRLSASASTWLECLAFGLVHLCHHGLIFGATGLTLLARSAPIWFMLMVLVAQLFAWLRKRSGSLYPAIASHAAFNLMMSTCIFLGLWPLSGVA